MFNIKAFCSVSLVLILISGPGSCLGIGDMSLEDRVGQLLIVGISGQELGPDTRSHLNSIRPGGIIFFKKNLGSPSKSKAFADQLQGLAKVPLLVAVDQEGGLVNRISTSPAVPSAKNIGRANKPALTERLGFEVGQVLLQHGINMNLAPVLDIGDSKNANFLKSRAYSSDPKRVTIHGVAYAKGLLRSGVLPTAKHFPGMGSVVGDPHLEGVTQTHDEKTLLNKDLLPFRYFSKLDPSAIMLSHATYTAIDKTQPAPLAPKITFELLNKALNYKGLVITDDLMMAGTNTPSISFEEKIRKVFLGGSDMMLIAWSSARQRLVKKVLVAAFKRKLLPESELNRRVAKILDVKSRIIEIKAARNISSDPESNLKKTILELGLVRPGSADQ